MGTPALAAGSAELAGPRPAGRMGSPSRLQALTGPAARTGLGLVVGSSLMLVLAGAARPSAIAPILALGSPSWLTGPLGGAGGWIATNQHTLQVDLTVGLAAMAAGWLLVVAGAPRLSARVLWGAIVAVHVIFFLGAPTALTDVFNYLVYSRMDVLHGLNPYVHDPVLAHGDPAYHFSTWHHLHSPYGPLFTLITDALVPLGLAGSFWALKVLVIGSSLACLGLVWTLAGHVGRSPQRAVALVALCPLTLYWGLGGFHNDVLFLLPVLAGAYAMTRGREAWACAALVAAASVKASAVLLLPLAVLAARDRRAALLGTAAAAVPIAGASLIAFGAHLPNVSEQSRLVIPLSPPNLAGLATGQGGATATVRALAQAGLGVVFLAAAWVAWRRQRLLAAGGMVMIALLLSLCWDMPWYVGWLLPFAALTGSRIVRRAALTVTAFMLFSWAPFLRVDLQHGLGAGEFSTPVTRANALYVNRLLD